MSSGILTILGGIGGSSDDMDECLETATPSAGFVGGSMHSSNSLISSPAMVTSKFVSNSLSSLSRVINVPTRSTSWLFVSSISWNLRIEVFASLSVCVLPEWSVLLSVFIAALFEL